MDLVKELTYYFGDKKKAQEIAQASEGISTANICKAFPSANCDHEEVELIGIDPEKDEEAKVTSFFYNGTVYIAKTCEEIERYLNIDLSEIATSWSYLRPLVIYLAS